MSAFWKNYAGTAAMLAGVIIGGLIGALWQDAARFVTPVGDIFINMLFVLVIPMVFFSISIAFCKLRSGGQIGRILSKTIIVFVLIWLTFGVISYITMLVSNPVGDVASGGVPLGAQPGEVNNGGAIVGALSVSDFPELFSKHHLLPLILFSALLGIGVASAGEKGKRVADMLDSWNEVIGKTMSLLMKAAPVGLGCYFAGVVANVGSQLLGGYLRVFVTYCILAAIIFFIVNPLLVYFASGRQGVKSFWKNILPPSITALATASSSVAMPGNIEAARKCGVEESVAASIVPLATNLLKGGSILSAVTKITFIMAFCGQAQLGIGFMPQCIGLAILSALAVGAVANGGVTGELLICTLLGLDPSMVGYIMIIGTIIDLPATLVNSQTNVVGAILVDRLNSDQNSL